jgi:glycosyltransferase involved in cell wall biosynthesis
MTEAQHQISVIIPFYKGNRYLPDCLAFLEAPGSVAGEELFVVDNGSDPPVVPDDFSIPWGMIVNPKGANGAGLCRHYGYERVRHRYVMFLDPDDALLPGCLEAYLGEVQARSLVFAFARFYEVDGERSALRPPGTFDGTLYGFLSKRYTVGCLTVMIDRARFPEVPKNYFPRRNDCLMWLPIIEACVAAGDPWGPVALDVGRHRRHIRSLSYNKLSAALWQWRFLGEARLPLRRRLAAFVLYAARGLRGVYHEPRGPHG